MMARAHNGQELAGPMASALGYQEKSVERHRFHVTVISVLRDCAVLASLKMRSLFHFNHNQVSSLISSSPLATLRDLAERNISQTRTIYERSKDAIQAVLVSWNKSFGAANQGAVALNLKVIDLAERNISTGFDLAMSLAGAKNVAEAVEMQSAYWRKQLGQLQAQAEEVKALLSRLNANVTEPIEPQMSLGRASSRRPLTEKSQSRKRLTRT